MTSALLLACIVILPIVILFTLRINATFVFLGLCLGDVLTQLVSTDTTSLTNLLSSSHVTATFHPSSATWRLVLLLLPVVVTAIIMARTMKGNSQKILNILPAAAVGLVGALLVVPLLPASLAEHIINNSLWSQLTSNQSLIVALSAVICLSMLGFQRSKSAKGKHAKHSS